MWRLVKISMHLSFILLVGQMSVIMGAKLFTQSDNQRDAIALYQAIMPGAPIIALEDYPCRWYFESEAGDMITTCQQWLGAGHFTLANVNARNQIIESVSIQIHNLYVGDLPEYWGYPHYLRYGDNAFARWYVHDYEVTAHLSTTHAFSYWSPISYMVIRAIS